MGEINDEHLIEIVKLSPIVWDLRQQNYRNTGVKDDAWAKIGKAINCSGNEARLRFATLREKFRKEKIIKEKFVNLGNETYKEPWPLYELMSFLAPVIKPRRKRTIGMEGSDSFLDYTQYKDEPFNSSMLQSGTDMKPNFPSLQQQDILPVFNPNHHHHQQHNDNEAIQQQASSTSQYNNNNIKISSPISSNTSQHHYLRSRSNSPTTHSKHLKTNMNQLLQDYNNSVTTSTLKKTNDNNKDDRDQFMAFGEFVGRYLSSLNVERADTLTKKIMLDIINFPKST